MKFCLEFQISDMILIEVLKRKVEREIHRFEIINQKLKFERKKENFISFGSQNNNESTEDSFESCPESRQGKKSKQIKENNFNKKLVASRKETQEKSVFLNKKDGHKEQISICDVSIPESTNKDGNNLLLICPNSLSNSGAENSKYFTFKLNNEHKLSKDIQNNDKKASNMIQIENKSTKTLPSTNKIKRLFDDHD